MKSKNDIDSKNKLIKNKKSVLKQIFYGITKFFIGVLIILIVFVFVIPGFLHVFMGKDIEPIDDSDMMLPVVTLADENNMFFDLEKVRDEVKLPKGYFIEDFLESNSWDKEFAIDVFGQNEKALEYFSAAAEKDRFLIPQYANPHKLVASDEYIYLTPWRNIYGISIAKAVWLANNGELSGAIKEIFKSIKVGDAIMKSQVDVSTYLLGLGMKLNGFRGLNKIIKLNNGNLDKVNIISRIDKYKNLDENYVFIKLEYMRDKNSLSNLKESIEKHDYFSGLLLLLSNNNFWFKPNTTIAKDYSEAKNVLNKYRDYNYSCNEKFSLIVPNDEDLYEVPEFFVKAYFNENFLGEILEGFYRFSSPINRSCELKEEYKEILNLLNEKNN